MTITETETTYEARLDALDRALRHSTDQGPGMTAADVLEVARQFETYLTNQAPEPA